MPLRPVHKCIDPVHLHMQMRTLQMIFKLASCRLDQRHASPPTTFSLYTQELLPTLLKMVGTALAIFQGWQTMLVLYLLMTSLVSHQLVWGLSPRMLGL